MKKPGKDTFVCSGDWTTPLVVVVPGNPVPLERHRSSRGHSYLPAGSAAYRDLLQWHLKPFHKATDRPVSLDLRFYRGDQRRCDGDNMEKAVLDAMKNGILKDDSQVKKMSWEKFYDPKNPRLELTMHVIS